MSINDYTRRYFAEVLQEMLKEKDLNAIRVNDLCARAGVQRGTFYYYFKDKYDLVSWIFVQDNEPVAMDQNEPYSASQLAASLSRMWEKRSFYLNVFNDRSQNALYEYIQDYDVQYLSELVKAHFNITELSEEQLFSIKYHSYGCLGYTIEWLKGKINVSTLELTEYEFRAMPQLLKDAYHVPSYMPRNMVGFLFSADKSERQP